MGDRLIRLSPQVNAYIKTLPPETRRKVRDALRGLEQGQGEIAPLQRQLEGYHRLKLPPRRVILRYQESSRGPECYCAFIEMRDVVYEAFAAIVSGQEHI